MHMQIHENSKIVELWLTRAEKEDAAVQESLKPIYQMCSNACRSIWAGFEKYLLRVSATAMPMAGVRNIPLSLAGI